MKLVSTLAAVCALAACVSAPPLQVVRMTDHPDRYEFFYRVRDVNGARPEARGVIVEALMRDNGLVPPECVNGIRFLGSSDAEGGHAHSSFMCR